MADEDDRQWDWSRPGDDEFLRARALLRSEFSEEGRRYLHEGPAIEAAAKLAALWVYWTLRNKCWRAVMRRIKPLEVHEPNPEDRLNWFLSEYYVKVLSWLLDGRTRCLGIDDRVPTPSWLLKHLFRRAEDFAKPLERTDMGFKEWHQGFTPPTDPWHAISLGRAMECLKKITLGWPEGELVLKERVIEGRSADELGNELGKTGRTVNRWLEHALDLLRKCVQQGEGTEE